MKTRYHHIHFDNIHGKKTDRKTWQILTKKNDIIGHVGYNDDWKQYCFYPTYLTVFSISCLADIIDFIKQL